MRVPRTKASSVILLLSGTLQNGPHPCTCQLPIGLAKKIRHRSGDGPLGGQDTKSLTYLAVLDGSVGEYCEALPRSAAKAPEGVKSAGGDGIESKIPRMRQKGFRLAGIACNSGRMTEGETVKLVESLYRLSRPCEFVVLPENTTLASARQRLSRDASRVIANPVRKNRQGEN